MRDLEIKVRALGYHLEEGELSSASAAKEVIAHFQSYLVKANERIAELEALVKECDDYLDIHRYTAIGNMSILHRQMKQLRKEQGE